MHSKKSRRVRTTIKARKVVKTRKVRKLVKARKAVKTRTVRKPLKATKVMRAVSAGQPTNIIVLPPVPVKTEDVAVTYPDAGASAEAIQIYLREIGQVKLLTREEEIALAKRVKKGDKAAREHMIKANLRLVVKVARDYEGMGLPLLDLISEGNIGLMKGVERFDLKHGAKLSTYASWWIKQGIKRALANQSKTIRLPVHAVDKIAHIRRAEMKLREILGRDPTDEEVAGELGLDAKRVRRYRDASRAPVSLDAPPSEGDNESGTVADFLPDPSVVDAPQRLIQEDDTSLVNKIMSRLDPRWREILDRRFGLTDGEEQTLEKVGKRFGITRERVRQIQEEALKTIRTEYERQDKTGKTEIMASLSQMGVRRGVEEERELAMA